MGACAVLLILVFQFRFCLIKVYPQCIEKIPYSMPDATVLSNCLVFEFPLKL